MIEVVGADRMRIQVDAAEIDDPRQLGRVTQDDLVRRPTRRKGQLDRLDPVRPRLGRSLLEEEVPGGAVHEPFHGHRPAAGAAQRPVGDGDVVANEIALGVAGLGEVDLVRVADRDRPTGNLPLLGLACHLSSRRAAGLPPARPARVRDCPSR